MKKNFLSLSLAIVCLTAVMMMTSCIYQPQSGDVVLRDVICVEFEQYETDAEFETRVVCDTFRQRLFELAEEHGVDPYDIKSLRVRRAGFQITELEGHDWKFSGKVFVDFEGRRRNLLVFRNQWLSELTEPTAADLRGGGVAQLNRALNRLLKGENPIVYIGIRDYGRIWPEPTPTDPLEFKWVACVEFQAVIGGHTAED
jgi:hypothetical protein